MNDNAVATNPKYDTFNHARQLHAPRSGTPSTNNANGASNTAPNADANNTPVTAGTVADSRRPNTVYAPYAAADATNTPSPSTREDPHPAAWKLDQPTNKQPKSANEAPTTDPAPGRSPPNTHANTIANTPTNPGVNTAPSLAGANATPTKNNTVYVVIPVKLIPSTTHQSPRDNRILRSRSNTHHAGNNATAAITNRPTVTAIGAASCAANRAVTHAPLQPTAVTTRSTYPHKRREPDTTPQRPPHQKASAPHV